MHFHRSDGGEALAVSPFTGLPIHHSKELTESLPPLITTSMEIATPSSVPPCLTNSLTVLSGIDESSSEDECEYRGSSSAAHVPAILLGTAVVSVCGASIEANILSPHSTLNGIPHKLFLSTGSFKSTPENVPVTHHLPSEPPSSSESRTKRVASTGNFFGIRTTSPGSQKKRLGLSLSMSTGLAIRKSKSRNSLTTTTTEAEETTSSPDDAKHGDKSGGWSMLKTFTGKGSVSTGRLLSLGFHKFASSSDILTPEGSTHGSSDNMEGSAHDACAAVDSSMSGSPTGASALDHSTRLRLGTDAVMAEADASLPDSSLLGLEMEEGVLVSWSLCPDAAKFHPRSSRQSQAGAVEWAECMAGEDRSQVVASRKGFVFAAVFDGFSDSAATDYLMANLYPAVCRQLDRHGVSFHAARCNDKAMQQLQSDRGVSDLTAGGAAADGVASGASPSSTQHDCVRAAMSSALAETEASYLMYLERNVEDKPEVAVAGACVVVALVAGNDAYVLNLGDCRAVLVQERGQGSRQERTEARRQERTDERRAPEGSPSVASETAESHAEVAKSKSKSKSKSKCQSRLFAVQLSVDHNTDNHEEVARLHHSCADDPDALAHRRVKGKLRVTRAFGAEYLKQKSVNDSLLGMLRVKYVSSSPYLSSMPHVRHISISPQDKYLVLSSDGLYQYMSNADVARRIEASDCTGSDHPGRSVCGGMGSGVAQSLVRGALEQAARRAGMSYEQLLQVPSGDQRRKLHDDMAVTVLQLNAV